MLESRFLNWAARTHYWHILDLGEAPADEALAQVEQEVMALVQALSRESER